MNIIIRGKGNTGFTRSILHKNHKIDKQVVDYYHNNNYFTNYKTINSKTSDYQLGEYGGSYHKGFILRGIRKEKEDASFGYNFDGVQIGFLADVQANGKYDAKLLLSYEEIEMLLLTKTQLHYIEINTKLENEKEDLEYEIRKLEREVEDLREKVKKFDEIKEKMNE